METKDNKQSAENDKKEEFSLKDLKFSFDLSQTNYEIDCLQNRLLQLYLRSDPRFRKAFSTNYTQDFLQFLKDKARLREPVHLAVIGQTRCQTRGSKILMANGEWKNIENIKIGDEVLSPQKDGNNIFAKVINSFYYNNQQIYAIKEMSRTKKLLYECSANHKIPIYHLKRLRKGKLRKLEWELKEQTAEELSKYSIGTMKHSKIAFSTFPITNFLNRINCEINPYVLGIFLGDGHFSTKSLIISNSNPKILEEISKYYAIRNIRKRKAKTLDFSVCWLYSLNGELFKLLEKYGLKNKKSGQKFIPKEALLSDMEYRKKLLAGLIDTDGYLSKELSYSITTKSKQLSKDIDFLVCSLGGRTTIRKIKKRIKKLNFEGIYYHINFYLGNLNLPLNVDYKKKEFIEKPYLLSPNRKAIKVIKKRKQEVYGIEIDSPSHYYVTDNFMITKNSGKSYTSISIAVFMMACYGKRFTIKNICANSYEFLEKLKITPEEELINSCYVIDEAKQTIFGHGSFSKKMKLLDVQNIIAMNNISTISLNPNSWANKEANYGLRTFGRCFKTKTCRMMLYNLTEKSSGNSLPLGNLYLPIFTAFLPKDYAEQLERDYIIKKKGWIKEEMSGNSDVLLEMSKKFAESFCKDKKFLELKTRGQKETYISLKMGSEWTSGEISQILELTKLISSGALDVDKPDDKENEPDIDENEPNE